MIVVASKNGNVGIGTSSPIQTLDVNGRLNLRNGVIQKGSTSAITATSDLGLYSLGSGNYMRFFTTPGASNIGETEAMRITATGNVGIGTTTPANALSVVGDIGLSGATRFIGTTSNNDLVLRTNNTDRITILANGRVGIGTTSVWMATLGVAGSIALGTGPANYQHISLGGGNSYGFLYGSFPKFGDGIHIGYNYFNDAHDQDIVYNTGGGTSRIFMGYGIVGVYTNSGANVPTAGVYIQNGATGWSSTSDIRLKTNIQTLPNVLDKISQIRGVTFNWKEGNPDEQLGFIAQEVEKVYPQVISKDKDGYLSIRYSELVPVLLQGIKEQQKQIEALEARIKALEAK